MERKLIKRSADGLWIQIIITGVFALAAGMLITWLVGFVFQWTPRLEQFFTALAWILFLGGWGFISFKHWLGWKAVRYEISQHALIVHAKAGFMGEAQQVYRYDSIISMRFFQGFWGRKFDYGDIYLSIPKVEQEIRLSDIEQPHTQIQDIQKYITQHSGNAQSFID